MINNNHRTHNQIVGQWGESIAVSHLLDQGFKIVEKNVRTQAGEIDVIAEKDGKVVFVEVKTRSTAQTVYPEEAITDEKLEHMLDSAELYLAEHPGIGENWRIDVIAVIGNPGSSSPQIEWFKDVSE